MRFRNAPDRPPVISMEALQLPRFLSDEREPVMRIVSIRVSDAVIDPGSAPHTQGASMQFVHCFDVLSRSGRLRVLLASSFLFTCPD
jgi:hypothetical protein